MLTFISFIGFRLDQGQPNPAQCKTFIFSFLSHSFVTFALCLGSSSFIKVHRSFMKSKTWSMKSKYWSIHFSINAINWDLLYARKMHSKPLCFPTMFYSLLFGKFLKKYTFDRRNDFVGKINHFNIEQKVGTSILTGSRRIYNTM